MGIHYQDDSAPNHHRTFRLGMHDDEDRSHRVYGLLALALYDDLPGTYDLLDVRPIRIHWSILGGSHNRQQIIRHRVGED